MFNTWNHKIFTAKHSNFEKLALEIFRFQAEENEVYRSYLEQLNFDPAKVISINQIPFLPILFFKTHAVQTTRFEPRTIFKSSGTTSTINSRHLIKDLQLYEESFLTNFEMNYGPLSEWCVLGLLPSYLERDDSSLVYMVNRLIHLSNHSSSGFYLDEHEKLIATIQELENKQQQTLLIGVTYALLDLAEKVDMPLKHVIIMETGGMKGKRKELIREDVHAKLKTAFHLPGIHSEYGMTELLSQAYSKGNGIFQTPPWMRILLRDEEDPLTIMKEGTGIINVIDLANIYSCCFIATDDAGRLYADGKFEVLGRVDGSEVRGCSLLSIQNNTEGDEGFAVPSV